jgi:hypothetical protein
MTAIHALQGERDLSEFGFIEIPRLTRTQMLQVLGCPSAAYPKRRTARFRTVWNAEAATLTGARRHTRKIFSAILVNESLPALAGARHTSSHGATMLRGMRHALAQIGT